MNITHRFLGGVSMAFAALKTATVTNLSVGTLTSTGVNAESVADGLTASTTQTLAGALALSKRINRVTTVATSGNAVKLPALVPGQQIDIYNAGANPMKVFPAASGVAIDGGSAGAAVTTEVPSIFRLPSGGFYAARIS